MTAVIETVENSYLWWALVSSASCVILFWAIPVVNQMSWKTACALRWAFVGMSGTAFAVGVGPLFGHIPTLPEGTLMISIALFHMADRRNAVRISRRDRKDALEL